MRHLASRECQKNNVLYQSIEIGACNIIGDFGQPNFPVPLDGGTTGTFFLHLIHLSESSDFKETLGVYGLSTEQCVAPKQ